MAAILLSFGKAWTALQVEIRTPGFRSRACSSISIGCGVLGMLNMVLGKRMFIGFGTVLLAASAAGVHMAVKLRDLADGAAKTDPETIAATLHETMVTTICLTGLTLLIGIGMAVFTTRGIKKILRRIYGSMDTAAGQMDATSYEILLSSRTLAETASNQAQAMDRTSSYLEKMAATTRTYATNTTRTDKLIEETNDVINRTSASVELLTESMRSMTETVSECHDIIQDIDGIASHTSLVAINAGMEAARAGHAALSFSVIADELRTLGLRTAKAAKRTIHLMETTIQKVDASSRLVAQTAEAFQEIASRTARVREYVAEIASASIDQATGLEQTHAALTEINRTSDQTAASAEGTSRVSGGLSAQSSSIRESLGKLIAFSYGNRRISPSALDTIMRELRKIAARADLKALDPRVHRQFLTEWLGKHSRWVEAIYTNTADGAFVFSEPPEAIPNACIRPWWQRAIQGAEYISPAYVSAITNKPCCTISMPLRDPRGAVAGVIGADIRLR